MGGRGSGGGGGGGGGGKAGGGGGGGGSSSSPTQQTPAQVLSALDSQTNLLSRESAQQLLTPLSRPQLLDIARKIYLPKASSMTTERLRTEIVEATVGHRLDAIAIHGNATFNY